MKFKLPWQLPFIAHFCCFSSSAFTNIIIENVPKQYLTKFPSAILETFAINV